MRSEVETVCAMCGKTYMAKKAGALYCSRKCRDAAYRARYKIYYQNEKKLLLPRVCRWCGKTYSPTTSTQKYCSEECRIKGKKETIRATKPAQSIEEIVIQAAEKGMSYGEYVGKYKI